MPQLDPLSFLFVCVLGYVVVVLLVGLACWGARRRLVT